MLLDVAWQGCGLTDAGLCGLVPQQKKKIIKIMKKMREGTYKVGTSQPQCTRHSACLSPAMRGCAGRKQPKPTTFLLWGEDDGAIGFQKRYKAPVHIPAPKLKLPGHAASYNPPDEYLLTAEEKAKWEEMDPERRPLPFMPTKYKSLRHVPLYQPLIKERFERCLDLYLCPRAIKRRLQVDPETLLPKLPSAEELRPYPTTEAIQVGVVLRACSRGVACVMALAWEHASRCGFRPAVRWPHRPCSVAVSGSVGSVLGHRL